MQKNLLAISLFCCASLAQAGACTREYVPVCGQLPERIQTFPNRCVMKNASATWLLDGECPPSPPKSKTPAE